MLVNPKPTGFAQYEILPHDIMNTLCSQQPRALDATLGGTYGCENNILIAMDGPFNPNFRINGKCTFGYPTATSQDCDLYGVTVHGNMVCDGDIDIGDNEFLVGNSGAINCSGNLTINGAAFFNTIEVIGSSTLENVLTTGNIVAGQGVTSNGVLYSENELRFKNLIKPNNATARVLERSPVLQSGAGTLNLSVETADTYVIMAGVTTSNRDINVLTTGAQIGDTLTITNFTQSHNQDVIDSDKSTVLCQFSSGGFTGCELLFMSIAGTPRWIVKSTSGATAVTYEPTP